VTPRDPAVAFVSVLLEDYADEWLWCPAMHYRWSFSETARLMSARPTEADFGCFASMFRRFFCDPTPARIMRDRYDVQGVTFDEPTKPNRVWCRDRLQRRLVAVEAGR